MMSNDQRTSEELKYSLYVEHGEQYTYLLEHYIENLRKSNKSKLILKWVFFIVIILIMIGLSRIFANSVYMAFEIIKDLESHAADLQNNTTEYITGAIVSLIPSLATLQMY